MAIAVRLFLTCWLVYCLHFASNIVREIYPALAIGDHLSFRVDEYANLHPDIFEMKGRGWYINSNPGASMLGALPYAAARPAIDRVVAAVNRKRSAAGPEQAPTYESPWPMARRFFAEAWKRGYDVKFGLAALAMHAMLMAPVSALGVVAMFFLLRTLLASDRSALWLSVLYAFGTPVFFRTGYLNHNMLLGHFAFLGFLAMWNPARREWPSARVRYALAGVAGGLAVLLDYSGAVILLALFGYAVIKDWRAARWYIAGTLPPVLLLWFYQWQCFGNPFLPAQRWMAPVAWIEAGYQGFTAPQWDLFLANGFDYRFGLFTACPLFLLALAAPFLERDKARRELHFILAMFAGFWLFCAGVQYGRLQFNTGIRYMAPMFPFLFVPAAIALVRLPRRIIYFVSVFSIFYAWSQAMYRDVERSFGLLEPPLRVFLGGFELPFLSVLSKMGTTYGDYFQHGPSPLPLFALAAALLYGIWAPLKERG